MSKQLSHREMKAATVTPYEIAEIVHQCVRRPNFKALIVSPNAYEMREVMRYDSILPPEDRPFVGKDNRSWHFKNGSSLHFGHVANEERYLGMEFHHVVGGTEVAQSRARLRTPEPSEQSQPTVLAELLAELGI